MVTELTEYLGMIIDDKVPDDWRWKGRKVKIVDGTTVTMPDTASNQIEYPQQARQQPGLGFPFVELLVLPALNSEFPGPQEGERALGVLSLEPSVRQTSAAWPRASDAQQLAGFSPSRAQSLSLQEPD